MPDSTTRYWKETPCRHGSFWEEHDTGADVWDVWDVVKHRFRPDTCPGGSRTLLTVREVDYEAGGIALARHYGVPPERVSNSAKRVANDVILAAFGGSVVLVEEGE